MNDAAINTTCAYCGVGCGVKVPNQNDRTIRVKGDSEHPANYGRLCVKGTHLGDVLPLRSRLLSPTLKGKTTTWDDATDFIAGKIAKAVAEHGPDSFAFYLSGQLLTEDYYAANKLAKGFLGTANVDTNSRLCMSSAVVSHVRAFGEDSPPISFEDIEDAEVLILAGSNMAWAHPVLFQRRMKAHSLDSQKKLVVIDPRVSASAKEADLHLAIKPGTDGQLFNALLVYLTAQNACDHDYITKHVENFDAALEAAIADVGTNIEHQAELCGVSPALLLEFFELFAKTQKTTTAWSMGINQSESGVDKGNALINCHLATGRIGKPGAGAFSITGQPNAMGGREVGGLANQLAVHRLFDEKSIQQVSDFWQAPAMATRPGLKAVDLFQGCAEGKIKVLWIMATNPVASLPDANLIKAALNCVETVIVSDVVDATDTLTYADIALPALAWGEKDGMVTNTDRTISRQRPFLLPPGNAQADWWAIAQVAKKLGFEDAFNWSHAHEIFREHAQLSAINSDTPLTFDLSAVANLTLEDYQQWQPQQWPIAKNQLNPKRLYSDGVFSTLSGKANMVAVKPVIPIERKEHEFTLNTGRLRDQWHTMARTGYASTLNQHTNQFEIHINPEDAQRCNIANGDLIEAASNEGCFAAIVRIEPSQNTGEVFAPMHWNQHFANKGGVANCIKSTVDPLSGQPASKHAVVTLKKLNPNHNGFLFIDDQTNLPEWLNSTTWFKSYTTHGVLLKFYSDEPLAEFIESQSNQSFDFTLDDSMKESAHWAKYNDQGLFYWLTAQTELCQWPNTKFLDQATHTVSINHSINAILTGNFEDQASGKTVCTCFSITDEEIKTYLLEHPKNGLNQLQASLKCGTNCGSCLTEVKELVANRPKQVDFYKAS